MTERPSGQHARPERVLPIVGVAVVLGLELAVAQASGSGWVQALGTLALGIALVGILGPALSLRRTAVSVSAAPLEATSGEECSVRVVATRSCRITPVRPAGPPSAVRAGEPTEICLRPDHRGVVGALAVQVSSAAPFAVLWWRAPLLLPLSRPITIFPARPLSSPAVVTREADGGSARNRVAPIGEPRGIRQYQAGDSPRRLHWRATAHAGRLMVREDETDRGRVERVVVNLPEDHDASEREASRQLGIVSALLTAGVGVVLETVEEGRPVVSSVMSERAAGHRLARAGRNPWGDLTHDSASRRPRR